MNPRLILQRLREFVSLTSREEGQALVEYALLISLVALTSAVAVHAFGVGVYHLYSRINAVIP